MDETAVGRRSGSAVRELAWVSRELPAVDGLGGQRRQYHLLRVLAAAGVRSTVIVPAYDDDASSVHEVADVIRVAVTVNTRARIDLVRGRGPLDALLFGGRFGAVFVSHTESLLLLRKARILGRRIPIVLDHHNVMSRWARSEGRTVDAARWTALERTFARVLALNVVSSEEEAAALAPAVRSLSVVRQGFDPAEYPEPRPIGGAPTVLYFGSLDFPTNHTALDWFSRKVWPTIRTAVPAARFRVVGKGSWQPPHDAERIDLAGWAPALAEEVERATVIIVPNQGGPGTRVKFPEAIASGRPVVSTTVGAQGAGRELARAYACADRPSDFAAECIRFLRDRAAAEATGRAGRQLALAHLTWAVRARPLTSYLCNVLGTSGSVSRGTRLLMDPTCA